MCLQICTYIRITLVHRIFHTIQREKAAIVNANVEPILAKMAANVTEQTRSASRYATVGLLIAGNGAKFPTRSPYCLSWATRQAEHWFY